MASPTQGPPPAIEISHEPTTSPPEPTNQAYLPYRSHSNPVGARDHVHQHQRQPSNNALERTQESEGGSRRSSERPRAASGKDRQEANGSRRPSHTTRICGKCEGQLTGQFVRALENTYHLECFTCNVRQNCNTRCYTGLTFCSRTVVRLSRQSSFQFQTSHRTSILFAKSTTSSA